MPGAPLACGKQHRGCARGGKKGTLPLSLSLLVSYSTLEFVHFQRGFRESSPSLFSAYTAGTIEREKEKVGMGREEKRLARFIVALVGRLRIRGLFGKEAGGQRRKREREADINSTELLALLQLEKKV